MNVSVKPLDCFTEVHGLALNASDVESIKKFTQEYALKALLPFVEKQISQLSEVVRICNYSVGAFCYFLDLLIFIDLYACRWLTGKVSADHCSQPQKDGLVLGKEAIPLGITQ